MRIAFTTPYLPAPANTGGRIRIHQLAGELAKRHELVLYARAPRREAAQLAQDPALQIFSLVRSHYGILDMLPAWWRSRRLRMASSSLQVRQLLLDHKEKPFDLLIAEHSHAAGGCRELLDVPLILDEHNIESLYLQSCYAARNPVGPRMFGRCEIAHLRAWERRVWKVAKLVTCVSERDAGSIRAHRDGPVEVIPNGVDTSQIPFVPPLERKGDEVLFIGMMSHSPNAVTAIFLANEVMPRVRKAVPNARLVLCGRAPTREVRALEGPGVEITGTVPSVVPYLTRASVYANALFQGAGSSLKVPEAMASGVPLVSTLKGVRGFPLRAGEHFLPAEDAETFADEIVRILLRPELAQSMALRARTVAEEFDWSRLASKYAQLVESCAARG